MVIKQPAALAALLPRIRLWPTPPLLLASYLDNFSRAFAGKADGHSVDGGAVKALS
jgi:hypothetical protein